MSVRNLDGETLDLLLVTHFPNSVAIEREAVPAAARHAKCVDWQVGEWYG